MFSHVFRQVFALLIGQSGCVYRLTRQKRYYSVLLLQLSITQPEWLPMATFGNVPAELVDSLACSSKILQPFVVCII